MCVCVCVCVCVCIHEHITHKILGSPIREIDSGREREREIEKKSVGERERERERTSEKEREEPTFRYFVYIQFVAYKNADVCTHFHIR